MMSDKDRFTWKMDDIKIVKKPWSPARKKEPDEKKVTILKGRY